MLVNVASAEVPALLRVNPGNPDASYIVQKLQGNNAVGARMPFGGPIWRRIASISCAAGSRPARQPPPRLPTS
jgi:hypothetical protein